MHIDVIFATTGRAETVGETLDWLKRQTRLPDRAIVVGADPADLPDERELPFPLERHIAEKGLCKQRNRALELSKGVADIIMFFDDDFFAEDHYLEELERLFASDPNLVGAHGDLIADGAQTGSLTSDQAREQLESSTLPDKRNERRCTWLYGCNMGYRASACEDLRFDENLPFYGWQEDVDFSARLMAKGHMVRTNALTGIHLGIRRGRTSGLRLGYSQVANILYLRRKGTLRLYAGWRLMLGNIAANLAKSIRPEPEIDRRGRLRGNFIAFMDLLRGRMDPRRIEAM